MTPTRLIMAVFFLEAIVLANWYPRIPDVAIKLGIGPADLSIGLIGSPLGTFLALISTGPLIQRFTARKVIVVGFVFYCCAMALPGWSWSLPSFFASMFLLGLAFPLVDVSMNVEAAMIQHALGRRIMSTCHGFWSVGSMFGAVIGAGFAQIPVDTRWHLLIVSIVALPVALLIARALPARDAVPAEGARRGPTFALPSLAMIGLCLFGFGAVMIEGGPRNWGAIYLRDVLLVSPGATGIGFAAFSLCMAVGRFAGDRLADRLGATALARICGVTALAGIVILVLSNNLAEAVIGMAAMGFGVSVIYPLAVSAAAARGDRPAPINVAALSLVVYSSSFIGPPLIGFVAQAAGLRVGMATMIPIALMSTLLAGEVKRRAPILGAAETAARAET